MKAKLFTLMLVLVMLLCACAPRVTDVTECKPTEAPATDAPKNEELTAEPTQDADDPSLSFVPRYGGFGSDDALYSITTMQFEQLVEARTPQSLAAYPTLVDRYPTSQSGILFPVTQEMLEQQRQLGQAFLAAYYGSDPSEYAFEVQENEPEYIVWYENDEITVAVSPWKIHAAFNFDAFDEFTPSALLENAGIKAVLDWRSIETPEVQENVQLDADGNEFLHEIIFAAHCDGPVEQLLNFTFHAVEVGKFNDGIYDMIVRIEEPEVEGTETPAVTAAQLDVFLTEAFPNNPPQEYATEVFYSNKIETGKYIPCYRIYIPEPDYPNTEGETVCSVINVTASEITKQ